MGYTQVALIDKILEIYPEIIEAGISPSLRFDEDKDIWIVNLRKGNLEFSACLDKEDADACIEFHRYCKKFGEEIGKIIRIMERMQSS
jgi:hypothetical protein